MESRNRRYERVVKILRVIAETDALNPNNLPNKYDIFKGLKAMNLGTEPTFLAAIDELEQAGLIQPKLIDVHARGGVPSKHYDLTLQGLKELLGGIYNLGWKGVGFRKGMKFSTLARRYSFLLPEIFGLWDRYEEQDVADLVQHSLVSINASPPEELDEGMKTMTRWKRDWLAEDQTRRPEDYPGMLEEPWRKAFVESVFFELDAMSGADYPRWRKALKDDPELAKPYLENLRRKKAQEELYLQRLDAEIRQLETR